MIYQTLENDKARFSIGQYGINNLIVFGINPSTATNEKLDTTASKIKGIAERNGYDGWIILNLYPQRATDPADLHQRVNYKLHQENLNQIKRLFLMMRDNATAVAAWGNLIEHRSYFTKCFSDIIRVTNNFNIEWKQLGSNTQKGHPRHPSRVSYELSLDSLDINEYARKLYLNDFDRTSHGSTPNPKKILQMPTTTRQPILLPL